MLDSGEFRRGSHKVVTRATCCNSEQDGRQASLRRNLITKSARAKIRFDITRTYKDGRSVQFSETLRAALWVLLGALYFFPTFTIRRQLEKDARISFISKVTNLLWHRSCQLIIFKPRFLYQHGVQEKKRRAFEKKSQPALFKGTLSSLTQYF